MKKNQNLQKINNNIFNRFYKFFKNMLYNIKENVNIESFEESIQEAELKKDFIEDIKIDQSKDRIVLLKQKFDNKMIDVKDISMKDKIELLEMYKKEILGYRNMQKK